jgi:hypothetical protein
MNWNMSYLKVWCAALLLATSTAEVVSAADAAAPREFTDFQLITERNIFDPNRRPRTRSDTPRPRQVVDSFSFTGTMNYSKGLFAFFDGTSSDYRKVAEKGEKIAGYTIAEIGHDLVKLVQDSNEVQLKVGMQMRRSEDGKWSAAEASANGGGGSSFAGNNSRWTRPDRRTNNSGDRDRTRNDFGSRNIARQGDNNSGQGQNRGDDSGGASGRMDVQPAESAIPLEGAVLDPNDPVARLILRRMQETGGGAGEPGNAGDQGTPIESGNQNDRGNQNESGTQSEEPDRSGNRSSNGNDNTNPSNEN